MRYMMFIKHTEDYRQADVPASLYEEMGKFIEETTKSGNFVSGAGLQPSSAGTRVRLKNGKITVMDGPFAESKELVGGYAIIDDYGLTTGCAHAVDEYRAQQRIDAPLVVVDRQTVYWRKS